MRPVVFMPPGMKPCKDKQEPEQLLKPVVFVSSELGEVIEKDDGAQPEDDGPQSQGRHPRQRRRILCAQKAFVAITAVVGIGAMVAIGAQVAIGALLAIGAVVALGALRLASWCSCWPLVQLTMGVTQASHRSICACMHGWTQNHRTIS